jgi:hypothetical protein
MPILSIAGLQDAQRANMRHIDSLKPGGSLGAAVQYGTLAAHRYNVSITHVGRYLVGGVYIGGGTLRASERTEISGLRGTIYVDQGARNPITRQRPAEYVMYEDRRGGSHASFRRTEAEQGAAIGTTMGTVYQRGLR